MVTGIGPGWPRNRADRGFGEIQSFWRFSGVQSSALTTSKRRPFRLNW
jgi:hypothetical protein